MKQSKLINSVNRFAEAVALVIFTLLFCFSACSNTNTAPDTVSGKAATPETTAPPAESDADRTQSAPDKETGVEPAMKTLTMKIDGTAVAVDWEDNGSVAALAGLVKDNPLTVQMSMYGGFEQVGSLGKILPRNDVQTTTQSGDIVLYSGNQIVVFYGSNSWTYTRLGHISDKSASQMKDLLGNGNVTIELSVD